MSDFHERQIDGFLAVNGVVRIHAESSGFGRHVVIDLNAPHPASIVLTEDQAERLCSALTKARLAVGVLPCEPVESQLPSIIHEFIHRDEEPQRANLRFTLSDGSANVLLYLDRRGPWLRCTNIDIEPRGAGVLTVLLRQIEDALPERFEGVEFDALTNERFRSWLGRNGYVPVGSGMRKARGSQS